MRVLIVSDLHLDAVTAGKPRLPETRVLLDEVSRLIVSEKIDLVLFGGDSHDPGNVLESLYQSMLIKYVMRFVASASKPMVVCIPGNHDVIDTSELVGNGPLTTLTPIRVLSEMGPSGLFERVNVLDRPHSIIVAPGWAVLGLPYVSRVHAKQIDEWDRQAFVMAQMHRKSGHKLIVIAHRVIPGAVMGSESVEMARGQDMLFPIKQVEALEPTLVINGHYHARQSVKLGNLTVFIPGSVLRFTFGEVSDERKGIMIAELRE